MIASLRLDRALRGAFGADALDRLGGRRRLGHPPRRPLADAEHLAVDPDLDPERLLVVRAGRVDEPVVGPLAGSPLGVFLQPALGALEREDRRLQRRARARPAP